MVNKNNCEAQLYEPIEQYFQSLGYTVQAEVNDCDIVAFKKDDLDDFVIVELKLNLNVTLLMQAANRQRYTSNVYIAIERPKTSLRRKRWRDLVHLVRRLELGLILVSLETKSRSIQVVHEPKPFDRLASLRRSKQKRDNLLNEARERKTNTNVGGSSHVSIMTVYRERSIQIAYYLDCLGPKSAKQLKEYGTGERTYNILYNNYYKWFKRVGRGVYDLTDVGREAYKAYEEVIKLYNSNDIKEVRH